MRPPGFTLALSQAQEYVAHCALVLRGYAIVLVKPHRDRRDVNVKIGMMTYESSCS